MFHKIICIGLSLISISAIATQNTEAQSIPKNPPVDLTKLCQYTGDYDYTAIQARLTPKRKIFVSRQIKKLGDKECLILVVLGRKPYYVTITQKDEDGDREIRYSTAEEKKFNISQTGVNPDAIKVRTIVVQ